MTQGFLLFFLFYVPVSDQEDNLTEYIIDLEGCLLLGQLVEGSYLWPCTGTGGFPLYDQVSHKRGTPLGTGYVESLLGDVKETPYNQEDRIFEYGER